MPAISQPVTRSPVFPILRCPLWFRVKTEPAQPQKTFVRHIIWPFVIQHISIINPTSIWLSLASRISTSYSRSCISLMHSYIHLLRHQQKRQPLIKANFMKKTTDTVTWHNGIFTRGILDIILFKLSQIQQPSLDFMSVPHQMNGFTPKQTMYITCN